MPSLSQIDFCAGHPNESLLPKQAISNCLSELSTALLDNPNIASSSQNESVLNYGDEPGNPGIRRSLADFIGKSCKDDQGCNNECDPDTLFVSSGVSHSIDLLTSVLINNQNPQQPKRDTLLIEIPTYFLASDIFKSHGLSLVSPPMDELGGGINLELFEDFLKALDTMPLFMYIIPTSHNPTGMTYTTARRLSLIKICKKFSIHILSDEVYHMLDWSDPIHRPPRMFTCLNSTTSDGDGDGDDGGCYVVSINSFTKIFSPGVRVGWCECDTELIAKMSNHGYIQSQGGVNPLSCEIMRLALTHDYVTTNIKVLTEAYKKNVGVLVREFEGCEDYFRIKHMPHGGYFLFLNFATSIKVPLLLSFLSEKYNVKIMKGSVCDPTGTGEVDLGSYARICFANLSQDNIEEGAKRISKGVKEFCARSKNCK